MNRSTAVRGYRDYPLPGGLQELETAGAPQPAGTGLRLIAADRKTLIWAQRLDSSTSAVLKMYRNRGAISWHREKHFRFRVQREFDSLSFLDSRGVPCSKPLFWCYGSSPAFGRYEILATRELEDIVPLTDFTDARQPGSTQPVLAAAYRLVRQMHRAGCHHGALFQRNILVGTADSQGSPRAFIIDMPKAIIYPYDLSSTKMAWIDLYLLTQSVIRHTGQDDCMALLEQYGLSRTAAGRFVKHLQGYQPSKLMKNLFRTECEIWEFLAHMGLRCYTSPHLKD